MEPCVSSQKCRTPYIRGTLYRLWREALALSGRDPVAAWASVVEDPQKAAAYKAARGKGGLVRLSWEEAREIIAASLVYTVAKYGPDRVAGFSPIPAMSMVSYAAGARFLSLLGGVLLSFYDWYADLPPASPQVWGEQTDVPESADWFDSTYLILWGANLPMTRSPDAHFLAEARYRGTKVVVVSPDYAENVKFADVWLAANPGTDGALAMAMTHVILQEFYVDHPDPYFLEYARTYTDLPFLVRLERRGDFWVPGPFLRESDIAAGGENGSWKTVVFDRKRAGPAVPAGSIGFRWGRPGQWNLKMEDPSTGEKLDPLLTCLDLSGDVVTVAFPCFAGAGATVLQRGVPVTKIRDREGREVTVTTVFDLLLANCGVGRGLPGDYPRGYDDPAPYTPAWQEAVTGVDGPTVTRVAREFAANAAATRGRSRVIMGAGANHWYHSDVTFRAVIGLVLLTGACGRQGGGWAYYVGQEKVRPLSGFSAVAFARDWQQAVRQQASTPFFYLLTGQWRYEDFTADALRSPLAGSGTGLHFADYYAVAARRGWVPAYPQFDANPLDLCAAAERAGAKTDDEIVAEVVRRLRQGEVRFAVEDPDDPKNFTRVFFVWRSNLIGSGGKGHEYFLKHFLGTGSSLRNRPGSARPRVVRWREEMPEGKGDLLVTLDFRMSDTAVYSDIVLPAATWYEKHDLSSTDLHPFIHPLNPAIEPPWEAKADWDVFRDIAGDFSRLAARHLGVRRDLVASPLNHDTPAEIGQPLDAELDWADGTGEAVPGRTMPSLKVVERDYPHLDEQFVSLGPLLTGPGLGAKGLNWTAQEEYGHLARTLGTHRRGDVAADRPDLREGKNVAEAILALSGATNGAVAIKGWRALERTTGLSLTSLAEARREESFSFADITAQPRKVITTPEWSGIESRGRRYAPFSVNVEHLVPWRTLTGRQHFYLDHAWIGEFGENLPLYRPPLDLLRYEGDLKTGGRREMVVRFISPHNKWSIHSTYVDTLPMLTLFRGGPTVWLNNEDAADVGIADNEWVELYNKNGMALARAVVSHRLPRGVSFMYHAQERLINMPFRAPRGERGGLHNSLTKIYIKPTHLIGGYAQLSYGFNYYGPIGAQKDSYVVIRKHLPGGEGN